jgi:Fe-S cluster assembly iron-binding protein IscA
LGLALDEPQEGDQTYNVEGIDILVDWRAAPYAGESTVDYIDSMWGKGFTIRPAYGGSC